MRVCPAFRKDAGIFFALKNGRGPADYFAGPLASGSSCSFMSRPKLVLPEGRLAARAHGRGEHEKQQKDAQRKERRRERALVRKQLMSPLESRSARRMFSSVMGPRMKPRMRVRAF